MYIYLFILGTIFGSFLNATALRISNILEIFYKKYNNLSFFKFLLKEFTLFKYTYKPKNSICPICKNKLKWWNNIPIISYIILKGKCNFCKTNIPLIYFISEIFMGSVFVLEYYYYISFHQNFTLFISSLIFFSILYIGVIIDIKTMLIPEPILILAVIPLIYLNLDNLDNIKYFILSIILAYIIFFIQYKYKKFFIGLQDIKIYAFSILLYNIDNIFNIIIISDILALPFYIFYKLKYNKVINDFSIYIYITLLIYPLLYKYNILIFF